MSVDLAADWRFDIRHLFFNTAFQAIVGTTYERNITEHTEMAQNVEKNLGHLLKTKTFLHIQTLSRATQSQICTQYSRENRFVAKCTPKLRHGTSGNGSNIGKNWGIC